MGERRFVIKEVHGNKDLSYEMATSITESELKRRIQSIDLLNDLDECIDILLNGTDATEKTQEPNDQQFYGKPWPKVHDIEEFYKEPDEWEKWIDKMPPGEARIIPNPVDAIWTHWWLNNLKDWLHQIPCRRCGTR